MVCIALLVKRDLDASGRDSRTPADGGADRDGGMSNSPGPSRGGPSRPEGGPRPPPQGFVNGAAAGAPSGLETRVDLINGNPARPAPGGRRRRWGLSTRKGRAAHEALAVRARGPLPGTGGQDQRDERD